MTPKEKAEELVAKYKRLYNYTSIASPINESTAIDCALIAVNEILSDTGCGCCNLAEKNYWNQVRQEIQKL